MLAAIVCLTFGTGFGILLSAGLRYLKQWGKSLIVTVNPNTHEVDTLWCRPGGEDYLKLLGSDIPLEGDRRYHYRDRPAFIVDTVAGHPLKVLGGNFIELPGSRLREIRRGIKQKIIAAANSANLEAYLKYALLGLGIIGVLVLGAVIMIAKVMQRGGTA
jgi:hypothetical protein